MTKLIGNGVVLFHRWPAEWAKVVADPGRIPSAAEEILRYWAPSQYQGRFTRGPVTFHGVTIPAGVPVLLLTGAASRDERAYPDPDRFDIDREQDIVLGFGYGIHSCLGAALARLESRIAFEELRARYPRYDVDERGLRRVHMANVAGFSHVPVGSTAVPEPTWVTDARLLGSPMINCHVPSGCRRRTSIAWFAPRPSSPTRPWSCPESRCTAGRCHRR